MACTEWRVGAQARHIICALREVQRVLQDLICKVGEERKNSRGIMDWCINQ